MHKNNDAYVRLANALYAEEGEAVAEGEGTRGGRGYTEVSILMAQ